MTTLALERPEACSRPQCGAANLELQEVLPEGETSGDRTGPTLPHEPTAAGWRVLCLHPRCGLAGPVNVNQADAIEMWRRAAEPDDKDPSGTPEDDYQ